MMEMEKS